MIVTTNTVDNSIRIIVIQENLQPIVVDVDITRNFRQIELPFAKLYGYIFTD